MKKVIILCLLFSVIDVAVMAQSVRLDNQNLTNQYLLLSKEQVSLQSSDFTTVTVAANCDYQLSTSNDWIVARKMLNGNAVIFGLPNLELTERQGTVTFMSPDGKLVRVLKVVQEGDNSVNELITEEQVKVSSASASESMSGNPATYLTDGDFNTIYHSTYSGNTSTTKFPVTLTFNFQSSPDIDYFIYTPRQDGNDNGNIREVEVWTRCTGESTYSKYGEFNFGGVGSATMIEFEGGLKGVRAIQLRVQSGQNNFVSGAEVQFFKKMADDPSFAVFGDDAWTTLKPGTTQADVNAVPNTFCRHLAQQLLDGTYDKQYRVTTHECKYSPQALSDMWNAPGKYYDQVEGVTGIHVPAGSQINVAVSGVANGKSAALKVVSWYTGENGSPHVEQYALRNGLTPILCIGETALERRDGETAQTIYRQLTNGLHEVSKEDISKVIIAYEPVWAISSNKNAKPAKPADLDEAVRIIRNHISKLYGKQAGDEISVLYGGSVNHDTAGGYLDVEGVDGLLIGGASLIADSFCAIVETAKEKFNER